MLRPFAYLKPASLKEALGVLSSHPGAVPLAGGTDLLVDIRSGKARPSLVVDLKGIPALAGIQVEDQLVSMGALVTVTDVLDSPVLDQRFAALQDAARVFGCQEICHRATLGGNLAHASPGSEYGTALAVFDARVELAGPDGVRILPLAEFLVEAGKNALQAGEILTRILIPQPPQGSRSAYRRGSRVRGMDLASFCCAVLVENPREVDRRRVRVAVGAMNPVPTRLAAVEGLLSGQPWNDELMARMQAEISRGLNPRAGSLRATPAYKRDCIGVLCRRALEDLCASGES